MTTTTKPVTLTPTHRSALHLIAGGNVIARLRGEAGYLTVNGNVENKLHALGLIAEERVGSRTRVVAGTPIEYDVNVWVLTSAGRAALDADPKVTAVQARELAKLARLGRASSSVPARTRDALIRAGLVREVAKPAGVIGAFGRAATSTVWVEITDQGRAAVK